LGDVTDPESMASLRAVIYQELGRLDILVNNAALDDKVGAPAQNGAEAGLEHYPLDQWRRMLDTNVTGVFLPCQVLGSAMADARSGSIINIASTYGLVAPDPSLYLRADGSRPFLKSPAYPTSKGAVIALTRYLAAYWGDRGVRVNALAPGGVANGQDPFFIENYSRRTPLGRMAAPNEYQGALLFLASDASSYTTGATLVVDGGFTAW
jgi:NAD(P)-dependent dehydrogenase (short-subunit alcohol dehydrogenase family)